MPRRTTGAPSRPYTDTGTTTFTVTGGEGGDAFFTPNDQDQQEIAIERNEQSDIVDAFAHNMAEADRVREVPRRREDSLSENPRTGRHLSQPDNAVTPLSDRQQRACRAHSRRLYRVMPKTEAKTVAEFMSNPSARRDFNNLLQRPDAIIAELPEATANRVRRLDSAIARSERLNDRSYRVYVGVRPPQNMNTEDAIEAFKRRLGNVEAGAPKFTFNGYAQGSHNATDFDNEIVMEIETTSGMYMGSTNGPKTHILRRGIQIQYDSLHQQTFVDEAGNTHERWVIKGREVLRDERTVARR